MSQSVSRPIRVLLVDDHAAKGCEHESRLEVIGEAKDDEQALRGTELDVLRLIARSMKRTLRGDRAQVWYGRRPPQTR